LLSWILSSSRSPSSFKESLPAPDREQAVQSGDQSAGPDRDERAPDDAAYDVPGRVPNGSVLSSPPAADRQRGHCTPAAGREGPGRFGRLPGARTSA